jgi:hypothetical protein
MLVDTRAGTRQTVRVPLSGTRRLEPFLLTIVLKLRTCAQNRPLPNGGERLVS